MRKQLTEKAGVNADYMTYEQLLVLVVSECGEHAVEEFLKSRYDFPPCRKEEDLLSDFSSATWEDENPAHKILNGG